MSRTSDTVRRLARVGTVLAIALGQSRHALEPLTSLYFPLQQTTQSSESRPVYPVLHVQLGYSVKSDGGVGTWSRVMDGWREITAKPPQRRGEERRADDEEGERCR